MVRYSYHAKKRVKERLDVSVKSQRNKLFNRALRYGHPPSYFGGEFNKYLENKQKSQKNINVKVYDGNIYIYKNKLIITVFPVPTKYLPVKENTLSFIKENELLIKLYNMYGKENVILETIVKDKDSFTVGLVINDVFENYGF